MRVQFIVIFFAVVLLHSCSNSSHCYESTDTLMMATFAGSKSEKIGPIVVRGYGKNSVGDTLFSNKDSALTKRIGLPLSLSEDSSGFVVYLNNSQSIFWIRHTMDLKLISEVCGFAPYYLVNATRCSSLIDSVTVQNPSIDPKSLEIYNTNGQNITIYLHLSLK